MKIAFFSDNFYPELSGVADSISLTGQELARRGHSVTYFVPCYGKKDYEKAGVSLKELALGPNVQIRRIFSFPYPAPTLQGRAAIFNPFRGFFLRERFDVIHAQGFFGTGIDALCLSKTTRTPLVGTNHTLIEAFSPYSPINIAYLKKYMLWYYNHCAFVSTPSEFLTLDMRGSGLRPEAKTVSNPIDPGFFAARAGKEALKKELGLSPFTILYAGRLAEEKNIAVLVAAFSSFAENIPQADLVLVGGGIMREALSKKSLAGRIKIMGPFLGEKKQKLFDIFHASDVFVMPSTSETQSMGVLQAMAASLPVIVARSGPLPGLVSAERGLLFESTDSKALRSQLALLASERHTAQKFGQHGNDFAKTLSQKTVASLWETIYTEIIEYYKKDNAKIKR